jgi:hypothetical protein
MHEALETLQGTFNKGNVYAAVKAVVAGETTAEELLTVVKPQKGGSQIENPTKVVDGETLHWDRLSEDYYPEEEMVFSNGKCKYVTIVGSKVQYRIQKEAKRLGEEALAAFIAGDSVKGGELNAESVNLKALSEAPSSYTREAMTTGETARFNPDIKAESEDIDV